MNHIETLYRIDLTDKEIGTIVDALNADYKFTNPSEVGRRCEVRELRNTLASLIHVTFMGDDA